MSVKLTANCQAVGYPWQCFTSWRVSVAKVMHLFHGEVECSLQLVADPSKCEILLTSRLAFLNLPEPVSINRIFFVKVFWTLSL
jgi:hypothetical protein